MTVQTSKFVNNGAAMSAELGTDPIPAELYYKPEYYELERAAIFKRAWLQIAHVCELAEPGAYIVREVEVADTSVLITRDRDGTLRAFHNVCTHRGTKLVPDDGGKRSSFTCRYHGWTFGNDGALRSAPDFEHFYVDKADCGLKPIAVDACAGMIFVNLSPTPAQSLVEFLGPMAAQLETLTVARATTFSEWTYEIDANWKLTYDNFQENYHLRFVHPSSSAIGMSPYNPFGYPSAFSLHGPHRKMTIWYNPDPVPAPVQGIGGAGMAAEAMRQPESPWSPDYFGLFPNFFMLGSPAQNFSHVVWPISATRTRGLVRVYWAGEDQTASQRFAREYSAAMLRDIHVEDRQIIEDGQKGLNSGALKHIHFQANELLPRHFIHEVNKWIAAYADGAA